MNTNIKEVNEHINNLNNEVAKLRELLERATDIADEFWRNQKQAVTVWHGELADELQAIRDEIQKQKPNETHH